MEKGCLVTVGTTSFDALIEAVSTEQFAARLEVLGYAWLRVQVGRGAEPRFTGDSALQRTWFRFTCVLLSVTLYHAESQG